jgi:hypothetical protein
MNRSEDSDSEPKEAQAPLVARRASRWLSAEELEAHIAAIIRLENVGVLLGAGASRDVGGKTMKEVWEDFQQSYSGSHKWLITQNFVDKDETPNIESLADSLEIALLEWARTGRTKEVGELRAVQSDLWRALISGCLLNRSWWEKPWDSMGVSEELVPHTALLQKLASARQPGQPSPWLFTTNYDLAIEIAAELIGLKVTNGFDGVHNRVFSPHNFDLGYRNVLARGEARFGTYNVYLAKLHGSLSWRSAHDGTYTEHPASFLWPEIQRFLKGETPELSSLPVFPSAAKYVQTVGFVLGELLRRFTEFLSKPQACLVTIGYSFSDEHLNRILLTALQNPTLQLVICLPEVVGENGQLNCDSCAPWVRRVAALRSPQVTVVGGDLARFGRLIEMLPDPVIYDEAAAKIKEALKEFHGANRLHGEGET